MARLVAGGVLLAAAFLGVSVWVVLSAAGRSEAAFPVWAALVLSMAPVNVMVFGSGVRATFELGGPVRRAGLVASCVVALVAAGLALGLVLSGSGLNRGFVLVSAALVACVPTLAGLIRIAALARRVPTGSVGEQVTHLELLLRVARRLLVGAGALVALTTVSLGAAVILQREVQAGQEHSSDVVLIFGGVGSALLAAAYLPAAVGIRARAGRLASHLFPLPAGDDAAVVLGALRDRSEFVRLLGTDRTVWNDLQSGSVILAPLLAAALTTFITPQ